ncbi:dynamin family protein [Solibacillus sp. FSL H8-0538]|uniref:dynamin family protein n=1 Tax=Solibacillus sp. FSL H8-0538 TaxID=2921400 RepID=UPI0030F8A8F9
MNQHLQQHQQRKDALISLLNRSKEYFHAIGEDGKVSSLNQFVTDLTNGDFSIVIVGEFSAGKSTFLNAVMGDRYLPSFTSETTATINYIKHPTKSPNGHTLQIDYKNPTTPTKYGEATKQEIAQNVSTLGGEQVVQDIESVTLYLDSPLLKQGITLVDSPGLNGIAKGHAEVTERQIERSHACVYMFAASQPGSKSDFETLAKLSERFDNIFLVLNQIDKIKKSEETVESVVERLRENYLSFFPDHKMPEIYPIAAYPALVARTKEQLEYPDNSMQKDHDSEARAKFLQLSRIETLESRLWKFITDGEKTIQELLAPAEMMHHELAKRSAFIKETIQKLEDAQDAEEINERIQSVEGDIDAIRQQLEQQKGTIRLEVKELVADLENDVKARIEALRIKLGSKINTFNDLDHLQVQIERINKQVNRECEELVSELDEDFTTSIRKKIKSKYKEIAIVANDKFEQTGVQANSVRNLVFEVNTDMNVDMDQYEKEKKKLEEKISSLRQKSEGVELKRLEARKIQKEMETLDEELLKIQNEEMVKMQMLGARPTVERYEKKDYREKKRGGVFGGIGNFLFGANTEVYEFTEYDDTAQVQYDKERVSLREDIQKRQNRVDDVKKALRSKNHTDQDVFDLEMQQIRQLEERIQKERERYIEEYSDKIQKEQQTVLTNIRYEFEDYISSVGKEILKTVRANIKEKEDTITNVIVSTLEEQFEKQSQEKKSELQQLIDILQSGETERAAKREELKEEQNQLKEIAKDVNQFISEIQSIQVNVIEQAAKQTTFI